MDDKLIRNKLIQIFSFAKALNELKNPIVSQIGEQRWHLWLDTLPIHNCIKVKNRICDELESNNDEDEVILKIKRPILTEAPIPPKEIEPWIQGFWKDVDGLIKISDEIAMKEIEGSKKVAQMITLKENKHIEEMFEIWMEDRDKWIEEENHNRKIMNIFNELYKLYSIIEKESASVDLVLGEGLLDWKVSEDFVIYHPVMLQKVKLTFDGDMQEFKIMTVDDYTTMYTALFRGIKQLHGNKLLKILEDLERENYDPMEKVNTSSFLKRLVLALSSEGHFIENFNMDVKTNVPKIFRRPVLFLRRRNLGFDEAINSIIEDIPRVENIPNFMKAVVGVGQEPIIKSEDNNKKYNPNGHDKEILFTKPANAEQLAAAIHLKKNGAVLVQGPPGTGKTHTIANIVGHLLAQGKSILITSHTEKALTVLREKIVKPLQPLCLPLLSDERGREELEKTLEVLNENRSIVDLNKVKKDIAMLQSIRNKSIFNLEAAIEKLKFGRRAEYKNIIIGTQEMTPIEAAKYVVKFETEENWIPSPVTLGKSLPLSKEELEELYNSNKKIAASDEEAAAQDLLSLDELYTSKEFCSIVELYNTLEKSNYIYRDELWDSNKTCTMDDIIEIIDKLKLVFQEIKVDWKLELIEAGYKQEKSYEYWMQLINELEEYYEKSIDFQQIFFEYGPEILSDLDLEELKIVAQDIVNNNKGKNEIGKLTKLLKPHWKKILNFSTVNGKAPINSKQVQIILQFIEVEISKRKVIQKWKRQVNVIGGPDLEEKEEQLENICNRYSKILKSSLNWYKDKWHIIVERLCNLGFDWNRYYEEQKLDLSLEGEILTFKNRVLKDLITILKAKYNALHIKKIENILDEYVEDINKHKIESLNIALITAIKDLDIDAYNKVYERIIELENLKPIINRRIKLLETLGRHAPKWAQKIRNREGIYGDKKLPSNYERAWLWRQLKDELGRRGEISLIEIEESINKFEIILREVTIELVEKMAWNKKLENLTFSQIQALESWKLTIRSIGAGHGKRIAQLQAQARNLMKKCQEAVPVWIMPLSRVVENFDPKINKFDVVIIDEASQADIMALIALYMGKQVIIVGDEEQVSPVAVGTRVEEIQNLINTHLDGIMNKEIFTGQFSIYDLAKVSGFQPVVLREHFRCISPIIQFSNYLSYDGMIKPLREEGTVSFKPALVPYYVEGACSNNKVNTMEAEIIVSMILACIEEKEYENKTFGVISLVGEEQAILIDELLHKHMETNEYVRRKVLCGNSAQFQGDERDVIFISMVDGPGENGPLVRRGNGASDMIKKRYNVAASRAADQMWVVYSLNPDMDLKSGDLRLKLIQHARNSFTLEEYINEDEKGIQSEFEKLVMKHLINSGYKTISKWKAGSFMIDMVVEGGGKRLAIECDGDHWYRREQLAEDINQQLILMRLGWKFIRIRGSQFFINPEEEMQLIYDKLKEMNIPKEGNEITIKNIEECEEELIAKITKKAKVFRETWNNEFNRNKK